MFSKKLSLYIPRIYPATILKHLKVYSAVYDNPFWVEVIKFNVEEGVRMYVAFMFEYLGYGTTQRVDLTKVNDFYQADVFIRWVESSDAREFQYEVSAGYRLYHPDQSHWIILVNTKKFELEPMGWMIDTEPDVLPPDYWDEYYDTLHDPIDLDYDRVYWY